MKQEIIKYAKSIGITDIGFTNIKNVENIKIKKTIPFKSKTNKKYNLKKYDTIISIIITYPNTCKKLENLKDNEVYFSCSSWGNDYHIVLKEKLIDLKNYIKKYIPNLEYEILIDNHPFDDRQIAYSAGLGFYGKNNLLINPKYGSFIFIGNMLTNLHLESDKKLNKKCKSCNLCIKNCPTKALTKDKYDYKKCLSYLTQKKTLTKKEESLLSNCIYGCDICAKVCPHNKKTTKTKMFQPSKIEFINVHKYKTLSNKEFKNKYGMLSGSWRGKKIIERNINIYKNKINNK